MRKYPIKKVARMIAQFSVQEEQAQKNRWIWRPEDFTSEELKEVQRIEKSVTDILLDADGKPWYDTLCLVKAVTCDSLFIGFKAQDRMISACAKCGIHPRI